MAEARGIDKITYKYAKRNKYFHLVMKKLEILENACDFPLFIYLMRSVEISCRFSLSLRERKKWRSFRVSRECKSTNICGFVKREMDVKLNKLNQCFVLFFFPGSIPPIGLDIQMELLCNEVDRLLWKYWVYL